MTVSSSCLLISSACSITQAATKRGTPVVYHPSNLGFRYPRQFHELVAIANQWRWFNDVSATWVSRMTKPSVLSMTLYRSSCDSFPSLKSAAMLLVHNPDCICRSRSLGLSRRSEPASRTASKARSPRIARHWTAAARPAIGKCCHNFKSMAMIQRIIPPRPSLHNYGHRVVYTTGPIFRLKPSQKGTVSVSNCS